MSKNQVSESSSPSKQALIAKIRWDCRRGMLELDYIFDHFLKSNLARFSMEELVEFQQFLENQDPDLFAWFLGYEKPSNELDIKWLSTVLDAQPPKS